MSTSLAAGPGFLLRMATVRAGAIAAFAFLYALAFGSMIPAEPGPFSVDEALYVAMADAMAARGDIAIQDNGGVDGAPSLMFALSSRGEDGRVYPQYPAGYAFIAAPFYALWGVYGLFFLNALAGLASIFAVFRLARRLFGDEETASWAAGLFAAATFLPVYAFAIWPHVLTLSILLGAAVLAAGAVEDGEARHGRLAAAGALIAAASTVRVDSVIFFAPLFLWLRLFAAPSTRLAIVSPMIGAAPVFALSALINGLKFGDASPITYGERSGYESLDHYAPIAAAAIIVAVVLTAFDFSRGTLARLAAPAHRRRLLIMIATITALAFFAPLARLAHNLWTLLVDIQAYDGGYFHDGLTRDAGGYLSTNGLPKKALLESMPFFSLALFALPGLQRGDRRRGIAFCTLFAAAPVMFYGIQQWHGGHAFNMRFLLPAVPFLTILAAAALGSLSRTAPGGTRVVLRAALAGAALSIIVEAALRAASPELRVPAATYPQLLLALSLGAAVIAAPWMASPAARRATVLLAGLSIGAAAASNYSDLVLSRQTRAVSGETNAYFAATLPPRSLVISFSEARLMSAFTDGVRLLHPYEDEFPVLADAIDAFDRAGRCVYVKKGVIADYLTSEAAIPLTNAAEKPPEEFDWFMTLSPVRPGCALS